jgi:hypothetical protein
VSFDVETVVDGEPVEAELFACFDCQDVFYFMADAKPRIRQLSLSQLYEPSGGVKRGRAAR